MVDVTPRWKSPPREPKARTRLRHQSRKRRREAAQRQRTIDTVAVRDGWRCHAAGVLPGQCRTIGDRQELELHEIRPRGRQPGSHLDARQGRLLCPRHHDMCTSPSGRVAELVIAHGYLLPAESVDTLRIKET